MITIESRWAWLKIWVAALFLIFAAVLLMWRFQENRLVSSIAEAILVTGFLAVIVDPFLKRDLLAEAERGVFMHFLGFEHHPQVKARLRDIIFETKLLREHLQMVLTVDPTQDGFWVTIDYDSDLLNPTSLPVPYEPSVEWDMGHKPQLIRMSFMSSDGKVKWTEKNIPLKELEPGVQTAKPHKISCKPSSTGVTYRVSGTYKILCKHGYTITYMGRPTLRTSVRVNIPDGYEVSATEADVRTGNSWEYKSIQMVGDHLAVRWRKIGGEWL